MNEPKQTQTAGGVVLNSKREVLVVSQRGTSWSLPKGHIDPGENAVEAARREICEESGVCDVELVEELGTYERFKIGLDPATEDRSERKSITMFLFTANEEALAPKDPLNPEARWVPKEGVAKLLTHPKDKEFFESVMGKI